MLIPLSLSDEKKGKKFRSEKVFFAVPALRVTRRVEKAPSLFSPGYKKCFDKFHNMVYNNLCIQIAVYNT